jgi:hypothetical protein
VRLDVGQNLLPLGDLLKHQHDVLINGQHLTFSTSVVEGNVDQALDRVEAACETRAKDDGAASKLTAPTRQEEGGVGSVLCPPADKNAFDVAAQAIRENHNLPQEFGPTHYTYAQPSTEAGKTTVLSVWSNEPIDFDKLYAPEGDAPGSEPPNAARPLGSRRILTASADQTDYVARIYETPRVLGEVKVDYDTQMDHLGWKNSQAVITALPNMRSYTRNGRELVVQFQPQEHGVVVAMAERPADKDD